MIFNENLKRYRENTGCTAKEFAKIIDLPYTTYISYENQGREPKYDTLKKIASTLHVSIDDLLGYDPGQIDDLEEELAFCKNNGFTVFRWRDSHVVIAYNPENQPVQIPDFTEQPDFIFSVSDLIFFTFDNEWFMDIMRKATISKKYTKAKDALLANTLQMTIFNIVFNLLSNSLNHTKDALDKKLYTEALNKLKHQKR